MGILLRPNQESPGNSKGSHITPTSHPSSTGIRVGRYYITTITGP